MEIIPDLSFCVTAGPSPEMLRLVLQAFYDTADHASFEIFVVGRSGDAQQAAMLARMFPEVHLFESNDAESLAAAQNNVLRLTKGRYVALWAGDLLCPPGCLSSVLRFLDDNPEAGLAGPAIVEADGSIGSRPVPFPSLWRSLFWVAGLQENLFGGFQESGQEIPSDIINEVDWLSGDCLLLRRDVVDEIGFLDEGYGTCRFDMDYCWRAKNAGWHVLYLPEAVLERGQGLSVTDGKAVGREDGGTLCRQSNPEIRPGDLIRFFRKKWLRGRVAS